MNDDRKARMKEFGAKFHDVRRNSKNKMTQSKYEELIGKQKNAASRYENGVVQMGVQDFEDGMEAFGEGVDIYDFFPKLKKPNEKEVTAESMLRYFKRMAPTEQQKFMVQLMQEKFGS